MRLFSSVAAFVCGFIITGEVARSQTNLECVGYYGDFSKGATDVAVSGHYLFLANGNDGLRIFDISNPTNPICVGHTNDVGYAGCAMGVTVFGDYAYVANSNDGMRIYDVSDPAHPVGVGHCPEIAMAASFGIAVSGTQKHRSFEPLRSWLFGKPKSGAQYAYLANYNDGMRIYDVSNPANPTRVSHVNDGGTALYPAVFGNYVYLANDYGGLLVYDVSNPRNPTIVGSGKDIGYPWDVAFAGKYAYVAENFHGLTIFDASEPTNPVSVGHINNNPPRENFLDHISGKNKGKVFIVGLAYGIGVSGQYAYLANFQDGVRVYDVSNPTNPINVAHTSTNYLGFAKRIAVSDGYVYVANQNDGLRIYRALNYVPAAKPSRLTPFFVITVSLILIGVIFAIWRFRMKELKLQ